MHFVYILKNESFPNQLYKGSTNNIGERLKHHNSGASPHTAKYRPWRVIFSAAFETEELARMFEKYLKTGSGIAFMRKHLVMPK